MAELKTRPNNLSVDKFVEGVEDESKRQGCIELMKIMGEITGSAPVMWGNSIVGYGKYRYKYESGREVDWFLTGFSPRKQNFTVYIMCGLQSENYKDLLQTLGKYKMGKSCLYFKKVEDLNIEVLKQMITRSVKQLSEKYSCVGAPS